MNVKKFNKSYGGRKKGIFLLTKMMSANMTQDSIAKQFGVTKERVRQWAAEFFGHDYDPRRYRKVRMKENMRNFALCNDLSDFNEAFRGTEYYKESLEELINEKVYVIKRS